MSGNDPLLRRWRLDMSIRIVPIDGECASAENMIDVLHCFAPHPLSVTAFDIDGEKQLLAASGEVVDPILGGSST